MSLELEVISLVFSLFGSALAAIAMYFSRFRRGRIRVLPVRLLMLQPTNSPARGIVLTMPMTFANDGAVTRAINDLRVRMHVGEREVVFEWLEEVEGINRYAGSSEEKAFVPAQPTLSGYESLSRTYRFRTRAEDAPVISGEVDTPEQPQPYPAVLEFYSDDGHWRPLREFTIPYNGASRWEMDFEQINGARSG